MVSAGLLSLKEFSDLFFEADGGNTFARAIEVVLAGARRDASRIGAACAKHSWEERFLRMEASFLPRLSRKRRSNDA